MIIDRLLYIAFLHIPAVLLGYFCWRYFSKKMQYRETNVYLAIFVSSLGSLIFGELVIILLTVVIPHIMMIVGRVTPIDAKAFAITPRMMWYQCYVSINNAGCWNPPGVRPCWIVMFPLGGGIGGLVSVLSNRRNAKKYDDRKSACSENTNSEKTD